MKYLSFILLIIFVITIISIDYCEAKPDPRTLKKLKRAGAGLLISGSILSYVISVPFIAVAAFDSVQSIINTTSTHIWGNICYGVGGFFIGIGQFLFFAGLPLAIVGSILTKKYSSYLLDRGNEQKLFNMSLYGYRKLPDIYGQSYSFRF
ncbi:MAG: hypothetical protein KAS39_01605 [Actinomycetia bacterium]|nr:hypothetical protein [Actinomycetes bacterium]